ncbi:uncharacterized protein B0H64DRAFT_348998 [Chaetomium fimeti]|uniref:Uncharacterized protein n=1 Tax=Chaetomium fimeti TaxID=1854472 RepID=A0AAE0H830_9PEZI|nr:hypothetical protein B0H64DRAFT_348998 [Chaetomium fimeti]
MSRTGPGGSSSAPLIGRLRVLTTPAGSIAGPYSSSPEYIELDPQDPEFKTLKLAVHLGLSMLESSRGRQLMADIGVNTVNHHRGRRQTIRYTDETHNMPNYVSRFLRTVRNDFFNLYLTNNIRNAGGVAQAQVCFLSGDIHNYHPKQDGRIKMSKTIIENMVYAARVAQDPRRPPEWRQSALRNFNTGSFQMGFATAHELVHKWVGYLIGDPRSGTPDNVAYPGNAPPDGGESGWFWESRFLGGGLFECVEDVSDPLGPRQAGKIYLSRIDVNRVEWARELDPNYIQRILNFDFSVLARPAPNSPPAIPRRYLPKPMERVRLENMPTGLIVIHSNQVPPEEQNAINRMRTYTVSVSGPVRPSRVV